MRPSKPTRHPPRSVPVAQRKSPGAKHPAVLVPDADAMDRRLDEELDETFPASDPVPARHDPPLAEEPATSRPRRRDA